MSEEEQNLEGRMKELENKINYVILQINTLQNKVSDSNPELKQMMGLLQVLTSALQISKAPFSLISQTLSMKDQILMRFPDLKYDTISESVISSLERKGRLNISQLTDEVRKERGSASRRIVRERVDKLIEKGLIFEVDEGYGRQLELAKLDDLEDE
ncbi:MAG: hypothetical protein GOP50_03925 [Candidatus Heimdallarchaeota archaeon]|nr:hypothetical protein [Candidatus Heimdallarchaeota archaeon]